MKPLFLTRWQARFQLVFNSGKELNRRVEIENELFMMAAGKKPIPSKAKCRELALKLGTPKNLWKKEWLK